MQQLEKKFGGVLRVQVCVSAMAVILLGPRVVDAYRTSQTKLAEWSETMAAALELQPGSRQVVSVNGEEFHFGVSLHQESVDQVLSNAERACQEGAGDLPALLGKLKEQSPAAAAAPTLDKLGILRRDDSGDSAETTQSGDVACFVRPEDAGGDGALLRRRIERFAETMNGGELGEARYVHAKRAPGSPVTRVLAVWTRSSLNFQRMLPEFGDSPGVDSADVPRPPAATREFSGVSHSSGDGALTYSSKLPPAELARFYEVELAKRAWLHIPFSEAGSELEHSRAFTQGGRAIFLSLTPDSDGQGTRVGIFINKSRGESKDVRP